MLTPEERFSIGIKVLERLKGRQSINRAGPRSQKASPYGSGEDTDRNHDEAAPLEFEGYGSGRPEGHTSLESGTIPRLADLVSHSGPFDPYSILLGACEDGLPFTLDLTDSSPGSLLIVGDPASGKTRLLHSILSSVALINRPSEVSYSLIVRGPQEFEGLHTSPHCQQVIPLDEISHTNVLEEYAAIVEQRRRGSANGPAVLLAVDDLALFLQLLNKENFLRFYALVKHGPRYRVWVIATTAAQDIELIDEHILSSFRTRLIGNIITAGLAAYITGTNNSEATHLLPGSQFCVPFEGGWLRFWIPAEN